MYPAHTTAWEPLMFSLEIILSTCILPYKFQILLYYVNYHTSLCQFD